MHTACGYLLVGLYVLFIKFSYQVIHHSKRSVFCDACSMHILLSIPIVQGALCVAEGLVAEFFLNLVCFVIDYFVLSAKVAFLRLLIHITLCYGSSCLNRLFGCTSK